MADTPSIGALAKLAIDVATPFDVSSEAFEFVREDIKLIKTHVESQGIRGTRSRRKERVKIGTEDVRGPIVMNPSVTEIDLLLPRILGGATSGGVTDVADALIEFQVMVDRVAKVHSFTGCSVASAQFRGVKGQPIELTINIEGEDGTIGAAGGFPAITIDTDATFFIFSEATLTLTGTSRLIEEFTLTIDNGLRADRRFNSINRVNMSALDRRVTLGCTVPYTPDNTDLEDVAIAGGAGILVLTDGSTTYTVDFANVKSETETPSVAGRDEIMLPLQRLTAYADATNSECKFTKT